MALLQLKKRFLADERFLEDYVTFMEGVIEKGYAERVESTQSPSKDVKKFEDNQDVSPLVCSLERKVWYRNFWQITCG